MNLFNMCNYILNVKHNKKEKSVRYKLIYFMIQNNMPFLKFINILHKLSNLYNVERDVLRTKKILKK